MTTGQITLRISSKIAFTALVALLIMAALFFRERLFADTSYIAFSIINSKHLAIQEHRYGSFITQGIPWLGTQLHLPLKGILIAYNISFNVFYCLVCALLLFRHRQYGLTILMALCYTLFVTASFFWPVNEINQAIGWMFLFFGSIIHLGGKRNNSFLLFTSFLALAFLTLSTHFVIIIPVTFLWVYFWLEQTNWPFSNKKTAILSLLLIAIAASKFLFVSSNSYDDQSMHNLTHCSLRDVIHSFRTPVVYMFLKRCILLYWPAIIILILGLTGLVKRKQKSLFTWTLVSLVGYFIVMGLTYATKDEGLLLFHIESEWECIAIIVATPFVFSYLPSINSRSAIWILATLFTIRIAYIANASRAMTAREEYKNNVMAKMKKLGISKLALLENVEIRSKYILTWGVPYETILVSAMNNKMLQPTFCFIYDLKDKIDEASTCDGFYTQFWMIPLKDLNHEYFNIDTVQRNYVIMKEADLLK
ncbi:MAG: hypothetical protein JWQ38_201 [Flavipsychrobacter sp.]|nr:hypothetical protein [Flavipsychrobacter sp.]